MGDLLYLDAKRRLNAKRDAQKQKEFHDTKDIGKGKFINKNSAKLL